MARTTISLPDPLAERLDRLRDRINVSKVCQMALEKECDMLEARPAPADPEIEAVIRRFQTAAERWHQRGHQDGRRWAVTTATRPELQKAAEPERMGPVVVALGGKHGPHGWPKSFDYKMAIDRWLQQDIDASADEAEDVEERVAEVRVDAPPFLLRPEQREHLAELRREVDEIAYTKGWNSAVRDVWAAVKPALQ